MRLNLNLRKIAGHDCSELSGLDLHGAFAGKVCPHPPCAFAFFSLTTEPIPPSEPLSKCNERYSPARSAYVRCSRFMIRPSGKLNRFMSNADYQLAGNKQEFLTSLALCLEFRLSAASRSRLSSKNA